MEYKRAILNFSFVTPGVLAGMARPGRVAPLAEDLAYLKWGDHLAVRNVPG